MVPMAKGINTQCTFLLNSSLKMANARHGMGRLSKCVSITVKFSNFAAQTQCRVTPKGSSALARSLLRRHQDHGGVSTSRIKRSAAIALTKRHYKQPVLLTGRIILSARSEFDCESWYLFSINHYYQRISGMKPKETSQTCDETPIAQPVFM